VLQVRQLGGDHRALALVSQFFLKNAPDFATQPVGNGRCPSAL
jgi:hypothetical protein